MVAQTILPSSRSQPQTSSVVSARAPAPNQSAASVPAPSIVLLPKQEPDPPVPPINAASLFSTSATEEIPASVLPGPQEVAAIECAALEGECDNFIEQYAQAPPRRDFIKRRDALKAQLWDARKARENYRLIGSLGKALSTLQHENALLPLSEEAYLMLFFKHAALVEKVTDKCEEILQADMYELLERLGIKLDILLDLDLSVLMEDPCAYDPILVEAPAYASTSAPTSPAHAPSQPVENDLQNWAVTTEVVPSDSDPAYVPNNPSDNDPEYVPTPSHSDPGASTTVSSEIAAPVVQEAP